MRAHKSYVKIKILRFYFKNRGSQSVISLLKATNIG